jgi:hypothetical protein
MQHIFTSLVNRFLGADVNEHEKAVASRFYTEGIKVGMGAYEDPAALLYKYNIRHNSLTKADIDSLVSILSGTISLIQDEIGLVKDTQAVLWQACDKDVPETAEVFASLNSQRNYLRKLKKYSKSLSAIQHKLKKYR